MAQHMNITFITWLCCTNTDGTLWDLAINEMYVTREYLERRYIITWIDEMLWRLRARIAESCI